MSDNSNSQIINSLSEEYLQGHLDRQVQMYFHIQKRAERLIQLLIASTAVIAAFGSTNISQQFYEVYTSTGPNEIVFEYFSVFSPQQQQELITTIGTPLSILLIIISLTILFDSITWAVELIILPSPRPYLGEPNNKSIRYYLSNFNPEKSHNYSVLQSEEKRLRNDIEYNESILRAMNDYLKRSYTRLAIGLYPLVISIIPYHAEKTNDISIMVGFSVIIVGSSIVLGIYTIHNTISLYRSDSLVSKLETLYNQTAEIGSIHFVCYIIIFGASGYFYIITLLFTTIWVFQII